MYVLMEVQPCECKKPRCILSVEREVVSEVVSEPDSIYIREEGCLVGHHWDESAHALGV